MKVMQLLSKPQGRWSCAEMLLDSSLPHVCLCQHCVTPGEAAAGTQQWVLHRNPKSHEHPSAPVSMEQCLEPQQDRNPSRCPHSNS